MYLLSIPYIIAVTYTLSNKVILLFHSPFPYSFIQVCMYSHTPSDALTLSSNINTLLPRYYVSKKWVTYVAYLYLRIAEIHKDSIDSMIWEGL